ncbi:hypothetical protein D9613_010231 [Agrocybe pediades]|uniref:Uncharacterized protein n=1 Tax=Agrocybe pediades TaxID=84607 RepID=A0A8H4VHH6_9AGAR|nr:hypothetical protein D9613_010231 [Agrocybe pediades]
MPPSYYLQQVTLRSFDLFRYKKVPTGGTIDRNDKKTCLAPGYYALFNSDSKDYTSHLYFSATGERDSYRKRDRTTEEDIALAKNPISREIKARNTPDEDILSTVLRRDVHECALSGPAGEDAVIFWIVPPAWLQFGEYGDKYRQSDESRRAGIVLPCTVDPWLNHS